MDWILKSSLSWHFFFFWPDHFPSKCLGDHRMGSRVNLFILTAKDEILRLFFFIILSAGRAPYKHSDWVLRFP